MRELYMHMTKPEHENQINASFKETMDQLRTRFKDKFPRFDWANQRPKKNYAVSNYEELDELPTERDKIVEAINMLVGCETEMNPVLTRRIEQMEQRMAQCDIDCKEMKLVVKQTLLDDGDLNVNQVKKELTDMRAWVATQLNFDRKFFDAVQEDMDEKERTNKLRQADIMVHSDFLKDQIHAINARLDQLRPACKCTESQSTAAKEVRSSPGAGPISTDEAILRKPARRLCIEPAAAAGTAAGKDYPAGFAIPTHLKKRVQSCSNRKKFIRSAMESPSCERPMALGPRQPPQDLRFSSASSKRSGTIFGKTRIGTLASDNRDHSKFATTDIESSCMALSDYK